MDKSVFHQPGTFFAACLAPLLAADVMSILVMYRYSVDRGMWPIVMVLMAAVSIVYAGFAWLAAALARHYDARLVLKLNALLGAMLVAMSFAYYLDQPDWNAVREGGQRLTSLQQIVCSHWMPWAAYVLFYVLLAWKLAVSGRKHHAARERR